MKAHLHKYKRTNIGIYRRYVVYRCIIPGCNHYIPKRLAEGKLCLCNRCEEPMILDKFALQFARPHCRKCTNFKSPVMERIKELV